MNCGLEYLEKCRGLIDAVGGVEVTVERTINDAGYHDAITGRRGFFIEAGALAWPNGLELSAHGLHRRLKEAGALKQEAA